jgi:hypothetical protein
MVAAGERRGPLSPLPGASLVYSLVRRLAACFRRRGGHLPRVSINGGSVLQRLRTSARLVPVPRAPWLRTVRGCSAAAVRRQGVRLRLWHGPGASLALMQACGSSHCRSWAELISPQMPRGRFLVVIDDPLPFVQAGRKLMAVGQRRQSSPPGPGGTFPDEVHNVCTALAADRGGFICPRTSRACARKAAKPRSPSISTGSTVSRKLQVAGPAAIIWRCSRTYHTCRSATLR